MRGRRIGACVLQPLGDRNMTLLTEPLAFSTGSAEAAGSGAVAMAQALAAHRAVFDQLEAQAAPLAEMAERLTACLSAGGKLLLCGQGASVPLARYLAGRLAGRSARGRRPLAVLALSADGVPWGDGDGLDLYARQVRGLGRPGDALLALSTSVEPAAAGAPTLLLNAVQAAREEGLSILGLLGPDNLALQQACHLSLLTPAAAQVHQQEAQMFLGHLLCGLIELGLGLG